MPKHIRKMTQPPSHIRQRSQMTDKKCDCANMNIFEKLTKADCNCPIVSGHIRYQKQMIGWIMLGLLALIVVAFVLQHMKVINIGFLQKALDMLPKGKQPSLPSQHLQYFFF